MEDERESGRVVYSRLATAGDGRQPEPPARGRGKETAAARRPVTPALSPLLVGFALLLALVLVLGSLSVRQVGSVSRLALELEQHRTSRFNLLLELNSALVRLDGEARARARLEAERRDNILPPVAARLERARAETQALIARFERLPLASTERGQNFLQALRVYLETTRNEERYSLTGFDQFRAIEAQLSEFLQEISREQTEVIRQSEQWREEAARGIRLLTALAFLLAALVAAGTIWEAQRRFRQLRRSLDEARRERRFSSQVLEGMVSGVAALDGRDRLLSANAAFLEIFPAATIGLPLLDRVVEPEAKKLLAAATASTVKESTYLGRWVLARKAGGEDGAGAGNGARSFDLYVSPLEIDEQPGQIVTLVDVTEAAEAEAEVRRTESLAAVGQASAQVAHEIKNPLGSIRLGVSMLRDMTKDEESLATISLVERGIEHLNKLTVDVTQFSRERPLERSETALHELLQESLELVADQIKEKQTPVEKRFGDADLLGDWDVDQLRQVFVNLFANALDASAEKSPLIITTERVAPAARADNRPAPRSASLARITIEDRGAGMDEATRARIFEPFFSTKKRGTGLGLAIVKKIIEQHDGNISVASAPGAGTKFFVELPLKEDSRRAAAAG